MNAQKFVILYTRQSKKKHKVWHDGTLKFISDNKGLLYDEKGYKLDSVFVKDDIQIGDQLESDHYLITIEEVLSSREERTDNRYADQVPTLPGTGTIPKQQSLPMQGRSNLKPSVGGNSLRQNRVGLKRQRNSGFVPPLLKTSTQVDDQREMSPLISDSVREAHQYANQNSKQNFVAKNVSASLNFEITKDNQTELQSSKSWFFENSNIDFGRNGPVHSGISQKIISEMGESLEQIPATNGIYINEGRAANVVKPKSTNLITETRIQTNCDRLDSECNMKNPACDSEIQHHNKSLPHFATKKATVPFTRDERVQDTEIRFNANLPKDMSGCGKQGNISNLNSLPNSKNKRTASQVLALLKSGTNEMTKNTERESSGRNLPQSVKMTSSEVGMSRDPKPFKGHFNVTRNLTEKQQEANFIDQESLRKNRNIVQLSEVSDNELCSPQNADRDSEFSKILSKDLDITNNKNQCDVSDYSSLNINLSPDSNFDLKNDKAPWGIGSPLLSYEHLDEKDILSSMEGFKRIPNIQESGDPFIRDKNDKHFNENFSEKNTFVPTALMNTAYPSLDSSLADGVSSDNISKNSVHALKSQENNDPAVASLFLESNNKSETESPILAEKHDQTLLNIDNGSEYETFQGTESNIRETLKRDLTLCKAVISSSLNDNPINGKEDKGSTEDSSSIVLEDIKLNKNNKDNQNKRCLVFSTDEEPQSKRFRIEPSGLNYDTEINRDDLYRIQSHKEIESKKNDIAELLTPKLFISAKGYGNSELPMGKPNQMQNLLGEPSKNVIEGASDNVLDEEDSQNVFKGTLENIPDEEFSQNVSRGASDNVLDEEVSQNIFEGTLENIPDEEVSQNVFGRALDNFLDDEELSQNVLKGASENVLDEEVSQNVLMGASENVLNEKVSQNVLRREPENVLDDEVSVNILKGALDSFLDGEVSQNVLEGASENGLNEEVSQNVPKGASGNVLDEEVSQNVFEGVSENVLDEKVSQNVPEGALDNILNEKVSQNFLRREPESVLDEEVSQNVPKVAFDNFLDEEVLPNVFEGVSENVLDEEVSANILKETSENVLDEEVSQNVFKGKIGNVNEEVLEDVSDEEVLEKVLDEGGFGLMQSKDNFNKSGISDSALLSNNKFGLTAKDELTIVNVSSFPEASNDKSISKYSFKSLSTNKNKESNRSQAEDNIMPENTAQNDISLQINQSENMGTLSNALSQSSLSNSMILPNNASSEACWDNSDDALNFDLSFDFEDNFQQTNDKLTDGDQITESENLLVGNIKSVSCFPDPQVQSEEKYITKTENKTETVRIPESISADDPYIGSNEKINKQNISDSSHVNRSILDNLNPQKTKTDIFDQEDSLGNDNPNDIIFDPPLSNQKETVQEYNQKEYFLNNPCVKKDGLILNNPCNHFENSLSESRIKHFDSSGSKVDFQGLNKMCESHSPHSEIGKNINQEVQVSNIPYSSLDELAFSPDPFDIFESGIDETSCQKEMTPSSDSGISKPLILTNIEKTESSTDEESFLKEIIPPSSLGSGISKSLGITNTSIVHPSVKALEISPHPLDKINTSGIADVDELIFSPMPYEEKVEAKLEFNSMNSISESTQNSGTLSEKSEVYRIGQLFPLTIGQNIPEERRQRLVKHQEIEQQQRLIKQTKSVRRPEEICEDPLPHPSRLKGMMDPPKKNLLSRAADLNGYRMHGSVFSDMVKRTKASRNMEFNSLVFAEEKWDPEISHNSTHTFSPQEMDYAPHIEEFRGDFNSIAPKLIKRTEMDTYAPRMKIRDKDLYNAQINATCNYDFGQIVPSHNDIICSPNNEIDITDPSYPNSPTYGQPGSPCLSLCGLSLKEFNNDFSKNTSYSQNEFISCQEFSNNLPLLPHESFTNQNYGLTTQKYIETLGGSSFDYEHHPKIQEYPEVSFDPHWHDPGKTFAYCQDPDTEQTKNLSFVPISPQSLILSIDPSNGYPGNSLHEINRIATASNSERNEILKENAFSFSEDENLEIQHILLSDNEESQSSDCQIISSPENRGYKNEGSHNDMKPLPTKRKTEPVKSKPFEDSVTHENYCFYHYSSKSCSRKNEQSEDIGNNTENEFFDEQLLTLSQESICLEREKQHHNSHDFERGELMSKNIQLKNEISNQFGGQKNRRDWHFIKENRVIINSQQEIGSVQFSDPGQDTLALFPESELLQTYSFPKECTSDNIREYDSFGGENDSTLCSDSFSGSFGLLSPLQDPFNEPKRLEFQDEDYKQLYNKPDFEILDQIHNEKGSTTFEPDISQIQKELEVFNPKCPQLDSGNYNSINLVTSNSYFIHSSSAHLEMATHNSSSQLTRVAQSFKSPSLTQTSSKIQSESSPRVATTDCSSFKLPKNLSEVLSSHLQVPKNYELKFPSQQDVAGNMVPKRRMVIPVTFQNVTEYKKVLTSVLKEHLNIILFELSSNYNNSMAKADLSSYQHSEKNTSISKRSPQATGNQYPNCNCGTPSKMIQVRKEGKNKGRFFYTCKAVQNHRCKFFQWADDFDQQTTRTSSSSLIASKSQLSKLCDGKSINFYLRRHRIMFYCESIFLRQSPWEKKSRKYQPQLECVNLKDRLYIRLSFKDPSGCYSKDDLWIISKTLNFEPSSTFIARSVFYGPNSNLELQIEPLAGYSPSNWNTDTVCHAILAGNVSTELSCLMNLQEHVTISSSPIISSLLHRKSPTTHWTRTMPGFKTPFQQCNKLPKYSSHELASLAEKYATFWKLNSGQARALKNVASMLDSSQPDNSPIILIHGVFGSGKSFLLAVIVMYLLDVIEAHQAMKSTTDHMKDEKILISSTTNVAVDRILLYLLEFGCSEFIRVGSVRKIAKPILPLSVHATSSDNHDLKELQEMLKEENLSKIEKQYVRKSIEMHKLGLNKKKLRAVKVVGVTCASCAFNCLEKMKFPIVLLDECSQMTEPASLLPLARFGCEKLLLVGDPLQLDPTIQGSEAENEDGLEQSMFDRLLKMGNESVLLQRQYRCHPAISHIANTLFYGKQLEDGIKDKDRPKLVPELPTLCFYDVSEGKEICESSGSFHNTQEADFVISIILALLACRIEPLSIGVIALYKSQTHEINRKMLESWQNPHNKFLKGKSIKSIQVSTVDAFQGGERDVIILSCVRTNHAGFINNNKRMNVALTRARNHLFIIGKSSNLCTDETWSQVIQICQNSVNSFQSAKQAKIKLLDLCSRAQRTEEEEEEENSVRTKTKKWRHSDADQEK